MNTVFLGGTCANNHWREERVIPELLKYGISEEQIINPVVEHWTHEQQLKEDQNCLLVFVLATPDKNVINNEFKSLYSLAEVIMCLYEHPDRTILLCDETGLDRRSIKVLRKIEKDIMIRFIRMRFSVVAANYEWLIREIIRRIGEHNV